MAAADCPRGPRGAATAAARIVRRALAAPPRPGARIVRGVRISPIQSEAPKLPAAPPAAAAASHGSAATPQGHRGASGARAAAARRARVKKWVDEFLGLLSGRRHAPRRVVGERLRAGGALRKDHDVGGVGGVSMGLAAAGPVLQVELTPNLRASQVPPKDGQTSLRGTRVRMRGTKDSPSPLNHVLHDTLGVSHVVACVVKTGSRLRHADSNTGRRIARGLSRGSRLGYD